MIHTFLFYKLMVFTVTFPYTYLSVIHWSYPQSPFQSPLSIPYPRAPCPVSNGHFSTCQFPTSPHAYGEKHIIIVVLLHLISFSQYYSLDPECHTKVSCVQRWSFWKAIWSWGCYISLLMSLQLHVLSGGRGGGWGHTSGGISGDLALSSLCFMTVMGWAAFLPSVHQHAVSSLGLSSHGLTPLKPQAQCKCLLLLVGGVKHFASAMKSWLTHMLSFKSICFPMNEMASLLGCKILHCVGIA